MPATTSRDAAARDAATRASHQTPAPLSRRRARAGTGSRPAVPSGAAPSGAVPADPFEADLFPSGPPPRRGQTRRRDHGPPAPVTGPGGQYPPELDLLVTPATRRERVRRQSRSIAPVAPSAKGASAALRRKALLAGGLVVTLLGSVMVVNGQQDSSFVDAPGQATSGQVSDR